MGFEITRKSDETTARETVRSRHNELMHGVKLKAILEYLVEEIGWEEMARQVRIKCFQIRPTVKSAERFLRKTEWAREEVEQLYVDTVQESDASE